MLRDWAVEQSDFFYVVMSSEKKIVESLIYGTVGAYHATATAFKIRAWKWTWKSGMFRKVPVGNLCGLDLNATNSVVHFTW